MRSPRSNGTIDGVRSAPLRRFPMRSRILVPLVALACLVPAGTASARPLYDPEVSTPSPPAAPANDGGESVFGYLVVGLGGLAAGAALTRAAAPRRVLVPANGGH